MDTMAVHTRRRPGRWTLVAGVALTSLGLLSFNAWATFTAQVTPTHASDTGDMEFTLGSADKDTSIATAATDIVPGDTITRTVKITVANEGGTMTGTTLTTSGSGGPAPSFVTTATTGLQLWIERCSVAYTVGPAFPGIPTSTTCSGTATDVLGTSGSPVDFIQSAVAIGTNLDLTAGAVDYLRIRMTLPVAAPDSMESQSSTLSFQFDGVQRAGTNK